MSALRKPDKAIDWEAVRRRMVAAARATEAAMTPSPERMQQKLEKLTRMLTAARDERAATDMTTVVSFALSGARYLIETCFVRGVVPLENSTPMPRTPAHVVGVIDLRGQMLPIFDVRTLLGVPADAPVASPKVLVCGADYAEFGVVVDEVSGVEGLHDDEMSTLRAARPLHTSPWAIGKDRKGRTVLDGAALLKDKRLFIE